MINIQFIKKHKDAKLPIYSTTEAAGADVFSVEDTEILPGQHKLIATGLDCNIPKGYELQVRPRSGLALKHKITVLNSPGTVDSDYTNELKVMLVNYSSSIFTINSGDRIAQVVVAPVIQGNFTWTESAKVTDRTGGFGSTGV